MQHNGWDHALTVTAGGSCPHGHAGAVLLRRTADQAGLTAQLSAAVPKAGMSPLFDRGVVLVSMAVAIALGATSMSDIALLAYLVPVLGGAPSGPTARRALDLAGAPAMLDRIARARARARAHAWRLIEDTPAGFPWLDIAGKALRGWLVIDLDATLVAASSDKEGAAPTCKRGNGQIFSSEKASTRWAPGWRTPASAWPCCCGPATPGQTRSPTTMPRQQGCRRDQPAAARCGREPPGQCRQDGPVGPARPRAGDLTAEHHHLMTQDHDLHLLGRLAAAQQDQPPEEPNRDQVQQADRHQPRSCPSQPILPNRSSRTMHRVLKQYRPRPVS
jgi:hypothetical protein